MPLWSLLLPALSVPVLAVFFGAETGGLALAGGATASALASDTVFAAIMFVCNGVVGLCVLVGGLHHRVVVFRVDATSPTLAALVAVISLWFPHPLVLGLAPKEIVLLALTFVVGTLTLGSGRATKLPGAVHLVLLAVWVFLAVVS